MMFSDGFDAFCSLDLWTPILSLIPLRESCRCLGACKGRVGDLAVFGRSGVKDDPKKSYQKCLGIL